MMKELRASLKGQRALVYEVTLGCFLSRLSPELDRSKIADSDAAFRLYKTEG